MTSELAPEIVGTPVARRRRWRGRERPPAFARGDWPEIVGRLLALRGVRDADAARTFLDEPAGPPDAGALPDIDVAIERLLRATQAHETVAVFGDFDVDGVTSVAQLTEALSSLGAAPLPYVPDRFSEGYGLNVTAVERLHADGASVLVTADCGTSSIDEVARARALGMDVIILDHHTVPPRLPEATALVNPKRVDARPGGLLELATAGLAFHVVAALHGAAGRPFDASAYLDLAALGTVCDMAPLADENRRLVRAGLPVLARTRRPGVLALMQAARVEAARVGAEDIGYALGPRLNAAGRIAHANLALELLMTRDEERGRELAQQLDALNRTRQQRTADAVALAQQLIGDGEPPALVMVGHPQFSSGVVGLIASKLVDLHARPAVVYERGDEICRASCRSIDGFHITDALRACSDLFAGERARFGGHRQAAGFSIETDKVEALRERLVVEAERALSAADLVAALEIDCHLPLGALRGDEIRWLARLGPFGIGNPRPTFLARGVRVAEARSIGAGGQHLRLKLRDGAISWPGIGFDLGSCAVEEGDIVDLVYSIGRDGWAGTLELEVLDLRTGEQAASEA
ncbi:MAG: single-stranded-DNA-specific exonuclease RecJ [Dehalococcoidia bacterium]|nr:single-stranded-DNA-specific exonuclease RecJ [Dehalococcoidia bacterium]